jgi:integrase
VSVHVRIRADGSKAYVTRWREGGSNCSRAFDRRADARAWDREVARRRQLGPLALEQLTKRHGPTLEQWITDHWAPEYASTLAQSTRNRYAEAYSVHVAPALGGLPLTEITVARVRAWQSERVKAGVQPASVRKARALLSSILQYAEESEEISANPVRFVRGPASKQRDAIVPLAPATVERIRVAMLDPEPRAIDANARRGGYTLPPLGDPQSRQRDALVVSLLAYAGLRPGEARALRWSDIGQATVSVQRATNPDGSIKAPKTGRGRSVRLLPALAQDLREYRLAAGRPPEDALILAGEDGGAWADIDWKRWREGRWTPACRAVGLDPVPRPYDCRHSFASLLLAEGRQPMYVASQMGHSVALLLRAYAHLLAEFEDRLTIDVDQEIERSRRVPA